ncbi:MAG TPA: DUF5666 domain-containing protein [Candidatus Elarobacter sp.]|nr:DUF5666 domain-containing protein [Candidatus Elarobacter sp.]
MMKTCCLIATMFLMFLQASAQVRERGGMNQTPGENLIGKVTAKTKDSLTIAPTMGGDPVTVKVSETTRVTKQRQPFKFEDIKIDEVVFARGEIKNSIMQAAMVGVVNPEMVQRIQQGGAGGGQNAGGFNREDLGKKFIAGEVKAISETKLTITRPDGQTQEIEVDENTSFKKGGESITLPDIKVGDFVRGRGELKDNVFTPKELIVGRGQMLGMMGGPGGQQQEQKKPESGPSGTPPAASPK